MLSSIKHVTTFIKLALTLVLGAPQPQVKPQTAQAPMYQPSAALISVQAPIEVSVDLAELRTQARSTPAWCALLISPPSETCDLNNAFEGALADVARRAQLNPSDLRAVLINTTHIGVWIYDFNGGRTRAALEIMTTLKSPSYERLFKQLDRQGLSYAYRHRGLRVHRLKSSPTLYFFQDRSRVLVMTDELLIDQYLARHATKGAQNQPHTHSMIQVKLNPASLYARMLIHDKDAERRRLRERWGSLAHVGSMGSLVARLNRAYEATQGSSLSISLTIDSRAPVMIPLSTLSSPSRHRISSVQRQTREQTREGLRSQLEAQLSVPVDAILSVPIKQPIFWASYLSDRFSAHHIQHAQGQPDQSSTQTPRDRFKAVWGVESNELTRLFNSISFGLIHSKRDPVSESLIFIAELRGQAQGQVQAIEVMKRILRHRLGREPEMREVSGGKLIGSSIYVKEGLLLWSLSSGLEHKLARGEIRGDQPRDDSSHLPAQTLHHAQDLAAVTGVINVEALVRRFLQGALGDQARLSDGRSTIESQLISHVNLEVERGPLDSTLHLKFGLPPLDQFTVRLSSLLSSLLSLTK